MRLPERIENYIDIPSKSMVPITIAGTALAGALNFSQEIPHAYPTVLAIGIAIGGTICRNHLRRQEEAKQQENQSGQLAEIIPFPQQKSA